MYAIEEAEQQKNVRMFLFQTFNLIEHIKWTFSCLKLNERIIKKNSNEDFSV